MPVLLLPAADTLKGDQQYSQMPCPAEALPTNASCQTAVQAHQGGLFYQKLVLAYAGGRAGGRGWGEGLGKG
jgi:hypothetical protein